MHPPFPRFVPFTCEVCGAELGEQLVPVCPGCRRVVCGRHLRGARGREDGRCDKCRGAELPRESPTSR